VKRLISLILLAPGLAWAQTPAPCGAVIDASKELLIVDPSVLHAPDATAAGPLSFATLFTKFSRKANSAAAEKALPQWLGQWSLDHLDSGVPSTPRSTTSLEWMWPKNGDGSLSLTGAPWVLTAITFRPDLAGVTPAGVASDGEAHLVYNLIDPEEGSAIQFTLIFEFMLPRGQGVDWVSAFHGLAALPFGPAYLTQLEAIVAALPAAGARLRTNDFFLAFVWDLREFQVDASGAIRLQPLPETPAVSWNAGTGVPALAKWVNAHASSVAVAPFQLDRTFQTANAFVPNEGFQWLVGAGVPEDLRREFSLSTCNGCHGGETTTRFTHIEPIARRGVPRLSDFLRQDVTRRAQLLQARICAQPRPAAPARLRSH
jgi:hypothetical protein